MDYTPGKTWNENAYTVAWTYTPPIGANSKYSRCAIVTAIEKGYGKPANSPIVPAFKTYYDPSQEQFRIPRKVIKWGSYLCADSYCLRYRPAARRPQMIDTGMSHIGIRCVRRGR